MSTVVAEPETTPESAQEPPHEAAEAERSREDLFEYSRWLHVGEGAHTCDHNVDDDGQLRATGKCTDPDHFHAWIRLPNQFQIRDIVEKARAGSARRKRILRNPESDAYAILESELDDMADPALKPVLVDEILEDTAYDVYNEAVRYVKDLDDEQADPDPETHELPKLYASIGQDQEEYNRLKEVAEDQRDADEYSHLEKRVADYSRAVNDKIEDIQTPRRETLDAKEISELVEMVRRRRIDGLAHEMYLHTYNTWQWYVCTYKGCERGIPRERYWPDIAVMKFEAAPPVLQALGENFNALEAKLHRSRGLGNS